MKKFEKKKKKKKLLNNEYISELQKIYQAKMIKNKINSIINI